MTLYLEGLIVSISDPVCGVSAKTGKPWKKVDIVVECSEGLSNKNYRMSVIDQRIIDSLKLGSYVCCVCYIDARASKEGRIFYDVRCSKVYVPINGIDFNGHKGDSRQGQPIQQPQQQPTQQQSLPQQQQQQTPTEIRRMYQTGQPYQPNGSRPYQPGYGQQQRPQQPVQPQQQEPQKVNVNELPF